jgi:hypothetical protein
MFRTSPVQSLRPYLGWVLLPPGIVSAGIAILVITGRVLASDPAPEPWVILALSVLLVLLVTGWVHQRVWRFARRVRSFQTWSCPGVVIHFEKGLERKWDFALLAQACEEEVADLRRRFGFSLRRPVVVYLFASYRSIGSVFGRIYAGTALFPANAVVVPDDCNTREILRHELVHLFAARWNWCALAVPLLSEGLATCLQETWGGVRLDLLALSVVPRNGLRLAQLLNRRFFFSDPYRPFSYLLAGSFTGFLIHRLGWDGYRRLFRMVGRLSFRAALRKCSGMTLQQAETAWRNEVQTTAVLRLRLERELSG